MLIIQSTQSTKQMVVGARRVGMSNLETEFSWNGVKKNKQQFWGQKRLVDESE